MRGYLITYLYVFSVIFGIGFIQKAAKFSAEVARKIIHILLCFTWLLLYHCFWDNWQIIIIPISFVLINYLSYRFKLLKMIERESQSDNHKGTIYFAVAMTALMGCALIFPSTIMMTGISVFCLCFGDGFAALFGQMFIKRVFIRNGKSVQGSVACIIGTIIGLAIFMLIMHYHIPIYAIIVLSVSTALLELVGRGLDNFSIVAGTYVLSILLLMEGSI